jgi:hypothetical protein
VSSRPDDEIFPSGRPSVSRSLEQSRLHLSGRNGKSSGSQCSSASVRTTWLYRPNAIQCLTSIRVFDSRHSYWKTAIIVRTMSSIRQERVYQVQPSGREPSWSGRSSFIYGNCVHQFNRPDNHPPGPDAPSLIMVIKCSRSATVRTLGHHCPDAALLWKLLALL